MLAALMSPFIWASQVCHRRPHNGNRYAAEADLLSFLTLASQMFVFPISVMLLLTDVGHRGTLYNSSIIADVHDIIGQGACDHRQEE